MTPVAPTATRAPAAVTTTRAQLLTAPGTVRPVDLTLGPLRADELLVEVRATGVCGSDVATFLGTHPYKKAPAVLGHEMAGVVVAAGAGVRDVEVGDLVASAAFAHCGRCAACDSGAAHLCADKAALSHAGWHGSFAEHVVLRERMVLRLPPGLPPEAGALVEPLAIGRHAAGLVAGRRGGTVVVLGTGTIGLATLLAARSDSLGRVVCVDRGPRKGELALRCGAAAYVDARAVPSVVDEVRRRTGAPADVTFVAAGYDGVLDDALAVTRPGGAVVLVSYFGARRAVDLDAVVASEAAVLGSALCTPADLARACAAIVDGEVDPAVLVTHRFGLEHAQDALELAAAGDGTVGKVLLLPGARRG